MKKKFLFISLLIFIQISLGQEVEKQNNAPKIGLVLSGGGAKGLAHIGVLKVIDSLGIKIDYIGGTSMGAVIGGLYASGYSGKQLDSIFTHVDVDALLEDYTPRISKNFYQKRNDESYAFTLPFDNFKIGLPSALSRGIYNYNLLSRLTRHVNQIRDFNLLPIPFFCIATDIETGKEIILTNGVLSESMIASGALPTLYNPVEINGQLLIDGGVVNNYPVEHVRKLGADFIIGVDVQDDLKNRENLKGATGMLVQVTNYSMIEKMEEKKKLTDIYIKPDIKGYTVVSFEKGKDIIEKGSLATKPFVDELSRLKTPYQKNKIKPSIISDSIQIKGIQINSLENYTRAYIIGKLRFRQENKISILDFEQGINNLNATQNFSSISYSFEKNDGGEKLILNLKEKRNNTFLKAGLHYDELFKSGILLNITRNKNFIKNDVLSFDLILGDNFRYNLNYYVDNGFYWSYGFNSKFTSFNRNISNDFNNGAILANLGITSLNIDYSDLNNQIYIQTIFAQNYSLGGGVEFKYLRIKSETLENTKPIFENSNYLSVFGYIKFDTFDQKFFPTKGWYFNGDIKSFLTSSNYNNNFDRFSIVKADMGFSKKLFKNVAMKIQAEGGFHLGEKTINSFDFGLGGYGFLSVNNFRPFYGYDLLNLVGDSYVKSSLVLDYEFYKKHHVNVAGNFANIGDKIFEQVETWLKRPNNTGYGIGYGYESIIGPIEIKHSWSPETRNHFTWLSIGFWF